MHLVPFGPHSDVGRKDVFKFYDEEIIIDNPYLQYFFKFYDTAIIMD